MLLDEHSLKQLVTSPTHENGHTLDLVMMRTDQSEFNFSVDDVCLSDHFMISFEVPISKPKTEKIHITSRNLKKIDLELFKTSLKSSLNESVVNSVTAFNNCLARTLDTFAPLRKKVISIRPFSPWINDAVKTIKQKKRQAERKWEKSGLTIHKEIFKYQKTGQI